MPYPNNQNTPRYNNAPRTAGSFNNGGRKSNNDPQTNGVMLANDKMGKFLRTRFWNRCMSIDIGTYAPGTTLDASVMQNAQVLSGTFSFTALFELHEICEEVLESIKQTNSFESTAILTGQKKECIVEISNGSNINMPKGVYLVIYKNVDSGLRSNTMDSYPFESSKMMRGYDHNTGNAKDDIRGLTGLKKFTMILKEAAESFTMAQAHAVRDASKNDNISMINMLTMVSKGLGIDVSDAVASASRTTGQASYNRPAGQPSNPGQYQRRSQPGQWNNNNRGGSFNGNSQGGYNRPYQSNRPSNFQQTQAAMAAVTDEPVDINLDAATLQQVDMSKFA